MKAAIITIGDEILIGQTIDTNSAFIAKSLDSIGIETAEMISISDKKNHIFKAFRDYQDKVDLVIVTGGLGPTKDDITKKTICDYFNDRLVMNDEVLAHVTQMIEGFYKRPITQLNIDQALVPSTATVLMNRFGTAPGMWLKRGKSVFISLPGVPFEMKGLMENEVIPKLVSEFKRPFIIHKSILTYGVGESLLAERIEDWESALPEIIRLAYLPSPGKVKLRLTARGSDKDYLTRTIEENVASLEKIIGDCIIGYDDEGALEVVVGKLLTGRKATVSTAESCTGGRIAAMLTAVPKSSAHFKGSVVCYATESKTDILNISKSLIDKYSVVSAEVAQAMAISSKKLFSTDYAIATTGNAGPSKGDSDAEVGTVFISIAGPENVVTEAFQLGQPREKVIERASNKALGMLRREILKNV